jgi:hypothetical protein
MAAAVCGLGLSGPDDDASARLTRPTSVALDFHDRTVADAVRAIENRSGKRVAAFGAVAKSAGGFIPMAVPKDMSWRDRKVTLESPAPVPFWEAIDRLAVASRLAYRLSDFGESTGVVFEGDGDAPGPACYAGPFRIGLIGIHEHREVILVRGPWVRFYPSGVPVPADAVELTSAPKDGGLLYAELEVAAEPGLVCRRAGPLRDLEALDEAGRSILAPAREDERQSFQAFAAIDGGIAPVVRVPLRRVEGGGASKAIRRLRGVIPVEVGALKPEPAVVIRLGDAEGRTFRGGEAVFTVETDRTESDGRRKLSLSCRLTGEEASAVRAARLAALRTYQLRVVDDRGAAVRFASSSSGGDGRGTLSFSYEYIPGQPVSEPPAEFRYYDLDRAAWQVPFEFHDIPLP